MKTYLSSTWVIKSNMTSIVLNVDGVGENEKDRLGYNISILFRGFNVSYTLGSYIFSD